MWAEGLESAGFPPLQDEVRCDVCVVGLGGSGLTAVAELLSLGASVVGIDAGVVAGGAAGRNGGFLLAGAAHGFDARLHRLTLAELDRVEADTPSAVRRVGSLRIALSDEELTDCERQAAAMRAEGFAVSDYEGPEGVGLLFPDDAATNPLLRCRLLAAACLADGARLFERTPYPSPLVESGATIICVDGRLEQLVPQLTGRVRTARLQMLATVPTTEVHLPRPVYARWGYDYWQQLPDGRVALGGQRDRFEDDEWTLDASPTADVQAALDQVLRTVVGVRQAAVTHRWAASAGFTPDAHPICEQVDERLWVAGGYSGTGNLIGALCGRRLAHLALGRADPYPF